MTPCLKQTKEKKKKEREIHHLGNKWTVQASDILKGYLPLCLLENTHVSTVCLIIPVRPLLHVCIQTTDYTLRAAHLCSMNVPVFKELCSSDYVVFVP